MIFANLDADSAFDLFKEAFAARKSVIDLIEKFQSAAKRSPELSAMYSDLVDGLDNALHDSCVDTIVDQLDEASSDV